MTRALIEVGIQHLNGSLTEIRLEPGTTIAKVVELLGIKLPLGYRSSLVTRTAEIVAPDRCVWEPQDLTMVRDKNIIQAMDNRSGPIRELFFVQIPIGTATIRTEAFKACHNLQEVIIPDSVTCIEEGAFMNCHALRHVKLPSSMTSIGARAFFSCRALEIIEIPASVTCICAFAFSFCTALKHVEISESVTSIGGGAFEHCIA